MKVMVLLAFTMRLGRGEDAAGGYPSMWADAMGGEYYCGNLLWQSCRTFCVSASLNWILPKSCVVCIPKFKLSSRFVMQGFRIVGILAVLSGEKEEVENYERENGIICVMKGSAE